LPENQELVTEILQGAPDFCAKQAWSEESLQKIMMKLSQPGAVALAAPRPIEEILLEEDWRAIGGGQHLECALALVTPSSEAVSTFRRTQQARQQEIELQKRSAAPAAAATGSLWTRSLRRFWPR